MVNAEDFTYSKGYLGLLSALGASLGITIFCAPVVPFVYQRWRAAFLERAVRATHINEPSLPITEDRPKQTHGRTNDGVRCNLLQQYQQTKASLRSVSGAVETSVAAFESSDMSLPMTEDNSTRTHYRSTRWNVYVPIIYQKLEALLERVPRAVHIDEGNPPTAAKNRDETLLPTTESSTDQIRGRSGRCSMDGCVAGTKPHLYGRLQRYRTF